MQSKTDWANRPERSRAWLIRLMAWIALSTGRSFARLFLYPISLYFLFTAGEARAASRAYLQKVFGHPPTWLQRFRHIYCFAATILDRVFLLNGRFDQFDVRVHVDEAVQALIGEGRGCILLGAHLGSFEIARAYAHERQGPAATMVMYEENAKKLNEVLNAINPDLEQRVIGLGKIDSMLRVEQALQRGEFIGILADRGLGDGGRSMACDFLGTSANFYTGPLRMAYLLKVPVLLMVGLYQGGNRYDLHIEQLVDMNEVDELPRGEVLAQTMARYVSGIEKHCRNAPYNWFNFYDFWK
jgi:predicted LPLAT superfamily acyltransferase